jgi:BirA family biotin operon repressor/biotin-[acetyl-CoA-carboxylase] ligase
MLDLQRVTAQLHGVRLRGPLIFRAHTPSTNDDASALAGAGAAEGTIVIAGEQSAGRGRHARSWFGHPDHSLLFSLVLRPALPPGLFPRLVNMVGVAVAEGCAAAAECAVGTKWPNDVIVQGRKIAGLLVEARLPDIAIVGIGINVDGGPDDLPPELRDSAGTLAAGALAVPSREAVLAAVLNATDRWYDTLLRGDWDQIVARQRELEITLGQDRTIVVGETRVTGTVRDLSPEGGLILEVGGTLRTITVGEIM